MADLRTDYKDDVLNINTNERRKYRMINNADGTISFEDVTDYMQNGDSFGATDVNTITERVNRSLTGADIVDNLESTATDLSLSANMGRELKDSLKPHRLSVSLNTTDWSDNGLFALKSGKTVCVQVKTSGVPTQNKILATGLPKPVFALYAYDGTATPSILSIDAYGTLKVVSPGTSNAVVMRCIITYFTNE